MRLRLLLYGFFFICLSVMVKCQTKPPGNGGSSKAIKSIEFTTGTRGYQKQVFLSADSLIEVTDGRDNQHQVIRKEMTDEQWVELVDNIDEILLPEIEQLPSPSSRRAFDGAKHSSIVITTVEGKSYTHAFDDENPHEKLQPLMKSIQRLKTPD